MVALSNIPFAICSNVILLGCLWLVYQSITTYLKLSPKMRFVLAFAIQMTATCKFILDIVIPSESILLFQTFQITQFKEFYIQSSNIYIFIGIIYCLAFIILLIKLCVQCFHLEKLKSSANYSQTNEWSQLIADIPNTTTTKIRIGTSALVDSPIVFGYIEPIILLPISICTQLNSIQLRLILLHELAHIIRKDYLTNWLAEIAKAILCFNPFTYIIYNEIHLQRELACDEFVIEHTNENIIYSKVLYELAKQRHLQLIQLSLGAMSTEHELLYRIKKINKIDVHFHKFPIIPIVLGILLFFTGIFLPLKYTKVPLSVNNQLGNKSNKVYYAQKNINNKPKQKFHNVIKRKKLAKANYIELESQPQLSEFDNNELSYNYLLNDTKQWIKAHENPVQLVSYNTLNDTLENQIAERLLISAIIKNYQLKKTLLEKRIENATDANEAKDFILNSSEWNEMEQYEKWVQSFLRRQ